MLEAQGRRLRGDTLAALGLCVQGDNQLDGASDVPWVDGSTEVVHVPDEASGREEEGELHVTDRRSAGREESHDASGAGGSAGAAESGRAGQPTAEATVAESRAIPVTDLVRIFIGELHARAWIHMGLVVDPATNQLEKDLAQARIAIDCIASLIEHLIPFAAKDERAELDRMVADLRMNFVRQSGT